MSVIPAEKKTSLFKGVNRVRVSDFVIAFIILSVNAILQSVVSRRVSGLA